MVRLTGNHMFNALPCHTCSMRYLTIHVHGFTLLYMFNALPCHTCSMLYHAIHVQPIFNMWPGGQPPGGQGLEWAAPGRSAPGGCTRDFVQQEDHVDKEWRHGFSMSRQRKDDITSRHVDNQIQNRSCIKVFMRTFIRHLGFQNLNYF